MSCVSPTSENLCINGCCWCPPRFEFVRWKLPCPVVHLWRQLSCMEREQQKSKAILFPWVNNIFWLKLPVACSSSNSKIVNCLECIVPYGEIALACSHIFPPSHSQIPLHFSVFFSHQHSILYTRLSLLPLQHYFTLFQTMETHLLPAPFCSSQHGACKTKNNKIGLVIFFENIYEKNSFKESFSKKKKNSNIF